MRGTRRRLLLLGAIVAVLVLSAVTALSRGETGRDAADATATFVPVLDDGTKAVLVCFDRICPDDIPERFDAIYLQDAVRKLNQAHTAQSFTAAERFSCHVITHSLGRGAVRSGIALDTIVDSWTAICVNGFPHGLIEELAAGRTSSELDAAVDELCRRVPEASHYSCVHGYGHAVAAQDLSYTPAGIERCGRFPADTALACVGGWFMRIVESLPRELPEDVEGSDLSAICLTLPRELAEACSYQMWMAYMGRFGADQLLEVCRNMPAPLVPHCVRGFGALSYYTATLAYVKDNQEMLPGIPPTCETITEHQSACLYGMLRSRAATWSSNGYRPQDFPSLCSEVAISRQECLAAEESGITA